MHAKPLHSDFVLFVQITNQVFVVPIICLTEILKLAITSMKMSIT